MDNFIPSPDKQYVQYTAADNSYVYHCQADPQWALADAKWQVKRVNAAGTRIDYPAATGASYNNVATNLAAVEALFA